METIDRLTPINLQSSSAVFTLAQRIQSADVRRGQQHLRLRVYY